MLSELPILEKVRQWDHHLLLNRPFLWMLRLPTLLAYFFVFNLLSVIVSLILPLSTYQVIKIFTWLWLFGVVELIAFGFWLRRFNWFSPEKALENTHPLKGIWEILIYMVCVLWFLSPSLFSTAILEHRFSQIVTVQEIDGVKARIRNLKSSEYFPQDLVEKYTRFDYATYSKLDTPTRKEVNFDLENVVDKLDNIQNQEDFDWIAYLTLSTILLHTSAIMFNEKHNRKSILAGTVAYGLIVMVFLGIIQGLAAAFVNNFTYISDPDYDVILEGIWHGVLMLLLLLVLFFSLRVFWQKGYKHFTAMNISLLPYVIYLEFLYWFMAYGQDMKIVKEIFLDDGAINYIFGKFWGDQVQLLILGTPLIILWVFVLTKAMYMQMLSKPED